MSENSYGISRIGNILKLFKQVIPADKFQNCIKSKEEIYSVSTFDINFLVQKNAWIVNYLHYRFNSIQRGILGSQLEFESSVLEI